MFKKLGLIFSLGLALTTSAAQAQVKNLLTGPSVTVQTDGTNTVGEVNISTQNTGPINFWTNNVKRGYIHATTGALTGFLFGSITLPNNTYLTAKNAAGNADIDVLKVDATDDTVLAADAGDNIYFWLDGGIRWFLAATTNDLVSTPAASVIRTNTSDAADTKEMCITGGGACDAAGAFTRGAKLLLAGNEQATRPAEAYLEANGLVRLRVAAGNNIQMYTDNFDFRSASGNSQWLKNSSGALAQDATNGSDIIFNKDGSAVRNGTSDAADNKSLYLLGGGAYGTSRGGSVRVDGNESSNSGSVTLDGGNSVGSRIYFRTNGLDVWRMSIGGTLEQNATNGGDIVLNTTNGLIRSGTSDAADNMSVNIAGGGSTASTRGAYVGAFGNEYGSSISGDVDIRTGDAAAAEIALRAVSTTGQIRAHVNGADRWVFDSSGNLTQDGTNGGSIILGKNQGNLTPILSGTSAVETDMNTNTSNHMGILINQNRTVSDSAVFVANAANTLAGALTFAKTRDAAPGYDADTIVVSGDEVGVLRFIAADGAEYRAAAQISVLVDGTPGLVDMPGRIVFATTPDGSNTPATALTLTSAQAATFTGVVTSTRTTDLGWSAVNAANQACNTTCTNACVFGMNTGALGNFVGCADATADTCICAGAS